MARWLIEGFVAFVASAGAKEGWSSIVARAPAPRGVHEKGAKTRGAGSSGSDGVCIFLSAA